MTLGIHLCYGISRLMQASDILLSGLRSEILSRLVSHYSQQVMTVSFPVYFGMLTRICEYYVSGLIDCFFWGGTSRRRLTETQARSPYGHMISSCRTFVNAVNETHLVGAQGVFRRFE